MPAKSAKQYKFMQMMANGGKSFDGGPSPKVAKEFVDKTPSKKRSMFMSKDKKSKEKKVQGLDSKSYFDYRDRT